MQVYPLERPQPIKSSLPVLKVELSTKALRLRRAPALEKYGMIKQELQMSWSRNRTHRVHPLL